MAVHSTLKVILLFILVMQAVPVTTDPPQARVMVFGDVIMHKPVTNSGYDPVLQTYQYDAIFTEVKPVFEQADLVIGNLETPLAGQELGFSGYPRFNGPKEIAGSLKRAGVDVLTTANNHAMDQWEKGVIQTLNHLDEYDILHTGTFRTKEERKKPLILEVNGLKIGLIAYTYGTNGLPVPKDKPYLVNLLNINHVREDVKNLRENQVDYIMAMIHYGTEYQRFPNSMQKSWTRDLHHAGVDFVLGSHPHVVQPLEIYKGNHKSSDQGVIYSLGNFISNQRGDWKDYGIILNLLLEKDIGENKVIIKEITVIPTYVLTAWEQGKRTYKVVPLIDHASNVDYTESQWYKRGQDVLDHVMREEIKQD